MGIEYLLFNMEMLPNDTVWYKEEGELITIQTVNSNNSTQILVFATRAMLKLINSTFSDI